MQEALSPFGKGELRRISKRGVGGIKLRDKQKMIRGGGWEKIIKRGRGELVENLFYRKLTTTAKLFIVSVDMSSGDN